MYPLLSPTYVCAKKIYNNKIVTTPSRNERIFFDSTTYAANPAIGTIIAPLVPDKKRAYRENIEIPP